MRRIAIVGGGVAGLSAAFALEQERTSASAPIEYVLFESSAKLGGVLVTEHVDNCVVEGGPDSFISEKPWAADLCREIGLEDQLIGSNDAERKTYILVNGRLVAMPDGLMFMVPTKILPTVLSPLFGIGTKLRMASEWFHPPHKASGDETVAALVARHYGSEMVHRLADPLLAGVYGGEAGQLSVRAVLPRFAEMEAKHGSLGRAMLSARRHMGHASKMPARPLFTSLRDGMQQMIEAISSRVTRSYLRTTQEVQAIQPIRDGWLLTARNQSDHFDAVILALPTQVAARLAQPFATDLATELAAIQYSSSVTVTLGYDEKVRRLLPPGFGFLVPRSEGVRMLACTFVHNKFPHRAPENRALIRCFLGGARDEQILSCSEKDIIELVRRELKQVVGVESEPLFTRVYKWRSAMAQYAVGHLDRLDRIDRACAQIPGLFLAGNGYRGIGVPDCVRSGKEAAAKALSSLGLNAATAVPDRS
ncbi:MAG TPA: protoporphyrinogen oxidase [Terriglobales bacterium]|jgi:protoporphyrinogen/coproporphyrinogen III oxidase|nr:protoporphyrinogen oxidase [Terriglobales bacterium]